MDKSASLTVEQKHIIIDKGTELPNTGEYNLTKQQGTYLCRRCGLALFRSTDKFISSCGWPSFDDEIAGTIKRIPDKDGIRTEIVCERCDGHLGHVFQGEYLTEKNLRHCVNSVSIDFVVNDSVVDSEEAIVAGGCFWGIEGLMMTLEGVIKTEVGYIGGEKEKPSYNEICRGDTGHYEAVRIVYDKAIIDYERIVKMFFECHDFTQKDGQGVDIGAQYRSAVFCFNESQHNEARAVIKLLEDKGYQVATELKAMAPFWPGEGYHQQYDQKQGQEVACHRWQKIF